MYMYYSSLNGMYVHVYVHGQSIVVIKQGTGVHICTLQDAHIILIYMYVTHVRSTWIIRDIFSTLRVYAIHYSILILEPGSLPLPTYMTCVL
jgi:hypothetical protein